MSSYEYLVITARLCQPRENLGKMPRLRRVLVEFRLLAPQNKRWRIRSIGTGELLQQRKKIRSLKTMPHAGQTTNKFSIPRRDPGERLLYGDRFSGIRQPRHTELHVGVSPCFQSTLKCGSDVRELFLITIEKLTISLQRFRL